MQSKFQLARLLFIASVALFSCGCYPHRGQPVHADANELYILARQACVRSDDMAADHLIDRLIREHPDSRQGQQAALKKEHAHHCSVFFRDEKTRND